MIPWPLRAALRLAGHRVIVPIAQCVHYGAFRYGKDEDHPYETYARKSAQGDVVGARDWFVQFLQHYRPRHMGEALGAALSGEYSLWNYPWTNGALTKSAWCQDPDDPPDIVTHYSEVGILWFRIEQEFFWLDRTLYSIRRHGYRPREGGGIVARKLERADGSECFLILDGNHRLSALAALGHTTVELTYLPSSVVREARIGHWRQVASGVFNATDARAVFSSYFNGNPRWRLTALPAPIIGRPFSTMHA